MDFLQHSCTDTIQTLEIVTHTHREDEARHWHGPSGYELPAKLPMHLLTSMRRVSSIEMSRYDSDHYVINNHLKGILSHFLSSDH